VTIRPIRYLGDPVLRQPAKKVRRVDDSIRRMIDDMIESMVAAQGVGLAAPQIGIGLRVVVLGLPDEAPFALVNPEVVSRSGERRVQGEGCLSVPGYRGAVTRSEQVTVKALDRDGKQIRIRAQDNLLAQALEHEVDHVNGILYVDRLDSPDDLFKLDSGGWSESPPSGEQEEGGEGGTGDEGGDPDAPRESGRASDGGP
jgi:peptide deformylase